MSWFFLCCIHTHGFQHWKLVHTGWQMKLLPYILTSLNALHHLVGFNYQREIITLHWDNVSVINSVSICLPLLNLGFLQKNLRRVWKSSYVLIPPFIFLDVGGTFAAFVCYLSHIQVILNLFLPSQWGDLASLLADLMQQLLVDHHLMHSKCVLIWWSCLRHSLSFMLSMLTCTATSLSLNFQDKCLHAGFFSAKW